MLRIKFLYDIELKGKVYEVYLGNSIGKYFYNDFTWGKIYGKDLDDTVRKLFIYIKNGQ